MKIMFANTLMLVAFSISPIQAVSKVAPSGIINKEEFSKTMREVWNDHGVRIREYIVNAVADIPSIATAAKRLLKNQEDIGNTLTPFYGRSASNKLTSLLKEHITIAVDLITAAKKGNTKLYNGINEKWKKNAHEVSTFLSKTNPHLSQADMDEEMLEHLKLISTEATARIKKNWTEDMENYDAARKHLNEMADMLSEAIIMQFPHKFQ